MGVNRMRVAFSVILVFLNLAANAQTIAIQADHVLTVSGPPIRNGIVIVKNGKIAAVGQAVEIPAGATIVRSHTVMPGLIDAHSYLGCFREVSEPADSLTPELRAVDAFDPTDSAIRRALRAGVTIAGIMPPNTNVIAGQGAVIRLGPSPTILTESAGLKISISPESTSPQRNPTSRAGIADLLVRSLTASRRGQPISSTAQTRLLTGGIPTSLNARVNPLAAVDSGSMRAFIHAPGLADAETALEVSRHARNPILALVHANDCYTLAPELKKRSVGVVLGPLRFTDNEMVLSQAGKLARAGVPVAFCTDAPLSDPGSLRMTAHLAVKYGMGRESALRALTINAARILGISGRTGSITAGMDADLLLLDGDPLDLTSRVKAVIAGGKIAHQEGK